jgi:hypothetical protein
MNLKRNGSLYDRQQLVKTAKNYLLLDKISLYSVVKDSNPSCQDCANVGRRCFLISQSSIVVNMESLSFQVLLIHHVFVDLFAK